ncbi:MAG: thiamine diphosphokinase [Bacteroidota bacterium]
MSSHHIVREGQEPALIIANGAQCQPELLHQLLEWSPYIVVLDGALYDVLQTGIKFDALLGDFDNTTVKALEELIPPDTEIIHTPDQDKTDLEKGLEHLISKKFEAVNIVWATGKRSDHYMNNIATISRYHNKIKIVMLDDYSKIYPIESGFKKHSNKGDNFSLIPLNEVKNVCTTNLVWNVSNSDLIFPLNTSSSNRVAETGFITVTFDSGFLLAMECHDIE